MKDKLKWYHKAIILFFCWPTLLLAQDSPLHYLEDGGLSISLMPGACVDPRSAMMIASASEIPQEKKSVFREIRSTWPMRDGSRQDYGGCWLELKTGELGVPEDGFLVIFSDGQVGFIPKSKFGKRNGQSGS